jgi:hypothetical protein
MAVFNFGQRAWYNLLNRSANISGDIDMSDEIEVEDDVFLEEGVLYCHCGNPIEAEDASNLVQKEAGREFLACPTCDIRLFADTGKFRFES